MARAEDNPGPVSRPLIHYCQKKSIFLTVSGGGSFLMENTCHFIGIMGVLWHIKLVYICCVLDIIPHELEYLFRPLVLVWIFSRKLFTQFISYIYVLAQTLQGNNRAE